MQSRQSTKSTQFDLVCIGEALIEYNQQPDGKYLQSYGGDVSNVAIAAARQGTKVAMATCVGCDSAGDALINLWKQEGINTDSVIRNPQANTGIYYVHHDQTGHHFSYQRKDSAASKMQPEDFADLITHTRLLHCSGISLAISKNARETCFQAIHQAIANQIDVSFDSNFRAKLWSIETARPHLLNALKLATIALPSLAEAQLICQQSDPHIIADSINQQPNHQLIMTDGANNIHIFAQHHHQQINPFTIPPTDIVDATGAGDCFDGVYLSQWLLDKHAIQTAIHTSTQTTTQTITNAQHATAAAALSIQGYGAISPIPHPHQIKTFLNQQHTITATKNRN